MPPSTTPNQPPEPGTLIPGSDPPPGPATAGYKLNHLMLRIRSPARSLHFYKDLLGLRSIFTMNAGPFTMYYLGYPPADATIGDLSNEDPQTQQAQENLQTWATQTSNIHNLTQTPGLLELYHIHGTEGDGGGAGLELSSGNEPPALGFGHVGFSVPDVGAAVERLRGAGVRVFKEVGETSKETVPISGWEEERGVGTGELHGGYRRFWGQIAYVLDPDGYFVELVPQNMQ